MDIAVFTSAINYFKEALSLVKDVKDILPDGIKKDAAKTAIDHAEREFKIAEGKAAIEFGYPICRCDFPPPIMLETAKDYIFRCPTCGKTVDTTPHIGTVKSGRRDKYNGF